MKLLLVRLSALGDVLHTLPALGLLRATLPEAELSWVVEPAAAPLLRGHPALDRVVVLDRPGLRGRDTRARAARQVRAALGALRAEGFDAALDLQGLLRSALVARFSGASRVFGPRWAREGARLLYSQGLEAPRPAEAHAVERAAVLMREACQALGWPLPAAGPLPSGRLPWVSARAEPGLLVLLPGAGKPANRPPPALLAELADRCVTARPELEVVLVGGPAERRAAQAIQARCRRAKPRSRCGEEDLRGSAEWLARAAVVVGGDTGPLHLARTLGRPVVALFHAADPTRTGPAGLPGAAPVRVLAGAVSCAPCCARRCRRDDGERVCLEAITGVRLAELVMELLPPG